MIKFIRKVMPLVIPIISKSNPVAAVVVTLVDKLILKQKEKTMNFLEGKKTYIGIIIAVVPVLAGLLGYETSATFGEDLTIVLNEIITLVGTAIAAYGRIVTTGAGLVTKK